MEGSVPLDGLKVLDSGGWVRALPACAASLEASQASSLALGGSTALKVSPKLPAEQMAPRCPSAPHLGLAWPQPGLSRPP